MLNLEPLFQGFSTPLLLIVIGVTLALLARSADRLVDAASALAERFGMPTVIIGATIVALGTTMPEFAVSVLAAWSGKAGLALGNAVGSILADTGLIFGLCLVITPLPANRFLLMRQGRVQLGSALLLALLCYASFASSGQAAALGRPSGILLLVLLFTYLWASIRWSKSYAAQGRPGSEVAVSASVSSSTFIAVVGIVVALAVLAMSSDVLIDAVTVLAVRVGIPQVVIAATLVALGTSLPELIVGITAVRKGQLELVVGNVIGADILNVLFVIGASAIAAPLPVIDPGAQLPEIFLFIHLPAMLVTLGVFRLFIGAAVRQQQFSRWMGAPLLALYAAYIIVQLFFGLA